MNLFGGGSWMPMLFPPKGRDSDKHYGYFKIYIRTREYHAISDVHSATRTSDEFSLDHMMIGVGHPILFVLQGIN